MTDYERKLIFFGLSTLHLLVRTEMEWRNIIDRLGDNAIDLGLADWVKQDDGSHEFTLIKYQ